MAVSPSLLAEEPPMKKYIAASLFLSGLIACSSEETSPMPVYESSREVTTVATVQDVDKEARKITLRGPRGNVITLEVDERVRNLPQVNVGDVVTVTYVEAAAVRVVKKAERAEDEVVIE